MIDGHFLILGGARSGKSLLGEKITLLNTKKPAYVATAPAPESAAEGDRDAEMSARIQAHQSRRGDRFTTYEEPVELGQTLENIYRHHDIVLVDCLTLWLANIGFQGQGEQERQIKALKSALAHGDACPVVLISNEVGQGIVPDNALARKFRDDAGRLHQELAQICPNVIMAIAGLPMVLKGKIPQLQEFS